MVLDAEDFAVLAQIRDGKSSFNTGAFADSADSLATPDQEAANHLMGDRLQRFYMAGLVTDCIQSAAGFTTVGRLTSKGLQVLNSQ